MICSNLSGYGLSSRIRMLLAVMMSALTSLLERLRMNIGLFSASAITKMLGLKRVVLILFLLPLVVLLWLMVVILVSLIGCGSLLRITGVKMLKLFLKTSLFL